MIYFYGGAFDPLTKAHLTIIKKIQDGFINDDNILCIGITDNDEKQYSFGFRRRKELVDNALNEYGINTITLRQNDRTYDYLKKTFSDNVVIVIGTDEYEKLKAGEWHNSEKLMSEYKFIIVQRNGDEKCKDSFVKNNIKMDDKLKTISSTKVREAIATLREMIDKKTLQKIF